MHKKRPFVRVVLATQLQDGTPETIEVPGRIQSAYGGALVIGSAYDTCRGWAAGQWLSFEEFER